MGFEVMNSHKESNRERTHPKEKKPSYVQEGENKSYTFSLSSLATLKSFVWTPDGLQPREIWNFTKIFPSHLSLFQTEMAACLDMMMMNAKRGIKNLALVKCLRRNCCFHQEMAITGIIRHAKIYSGEGEWPIPLVVRYIYSKFIYIMFGKSMC